MVKYKINKFYFVKNQVCFAIVLILVFSFLVYLSPFKAVHAAKFQSRAIINVPLSCPDLNKDGLNDMSGIACPIDATCNDINDDGLIDNTGVPCPSSPTVPTAVPENCANMVDDNNNGQIDEEPCVRFAGPVGTCGLEIVSGVPINYGMLNLGQDSKEQEVTLKNVGNVTAQIMVKGGDWVSDAASNPTMSGPEITHVAIKPNLTWADKMKLGSSADALGAIDIQQPLPVYFQLKVPVSGFSGSLHQDVTIDLLC